MTRPSSQPSGQVRTDKPAAASVTRSGDRAPTAAGDVAAPAAPAGLSLGWRVALVFWAGAFVVLLLVELVQLAVKLFRQMF